MAEKGIGDDRGRGPRKGQRLREMHLVLLAVGMIAAAVALGLPSWLDDGDGSAPALPRTMDGSPLALRLRDRAPTGTFAIPIMPPQELDHLRRDEVLSRRMQALAERPELFDATQYHFSQHIFGRIKDGLPWWGSDGLYFHGPGQRSIDGPSSHSIWIQNPYLLVGVMESMAYITRLEPGGEATYPRPVQLQWSPQEAMIRVEYDLSGWDAHVQGLEQMQGLEISGINAQDFDFHFLQVNASASSGMRMRFPHLRPVKLRQFFAPGPACRYPGGCNNIGPHTDELGFMVTEFPVRIRGKLWREEPPGNDTPPDLTFELVLTAAPP